MFGGGSPAAEEAAAAAEAALEAAADAADAEPAPLTMTEDLANARIFINWIQAGSIISL